MRLTMETSMIRAALIVSGLALAACANAASPPPPVPGPAAPLAYGQGVAQRSCGGCHAVAEGASPLAAAPPFRVLHRRYPAGGLAQLLDEGMLPPDRPVEEGSPATHPNMPRVALDPDEVAALTAYLRSLEPKP